MNYTILSNGDLKITVTPEEQADFQQWRKEQNADGSNRFGSNDTLWTLFESLISDTDLEWCEPAWVGALTDAPMLGIWGDEVLLPPDEDYRDHQLAHGDGVNTWVNTWNKVWAFMSYALRSPQEDIADQRYCIFESGNEEVA